MRDIILSLPDQFEKGFYTKSFKEHKLGKIDKIYYFGMGGSGIAGDIIQNYFLISSKIPFIVIKDYILPVSTHKDFFIFVSYSGNTEETLEVFSKLEKNLTKVFIVSSDGELLEKAKKLGFPYFEVPKGLPPRGAIGYLFSSILRFLSDVKITPNLEDDVNEVINLLRNNVKIYEERAKEFSEHLLNKLPVIYSLSHLYYPAAYRFQSQLNENSKIFAHSHSLPEMNHNEIMGYKGVKNVLKNLSIIYLIDRDAHPRILKRQKIMSSILKDIPQSYLYAEGSSFISKIFSLIFQADLISFYLAEKRKVDPFDISYINTLKEKLK